MRFYVAVVTATTLLLLCYSSGILEFMTRYLRNISGGAKLAS